MHKVWAWGAATAYCLELPSGAKYPIKTHLHHVNNGSSDFLLYLRVASICYPTLVPKRTENTWHTWYTIRKLQNQSSHFKSVRSESSFSFYHIIFLFVSPTFRAVVCTKYVGYENQDGSLSLRNSFVGPFVCGCHGTTAACCFMPARCTR